MDKLQMAQQYILKAMDQQGLHVYVSDIERAFDIADMMLAEEEKRMDKTRHAVLDEFQVDWNQAPHDAKYYAIDENMGAHWYRTKPIISQLFDDQWIGGGYDQNIKAPSFNYKGDWKDSLRERPR